MTRIAVLGLIPILVSGCSTQTTTFEITDYRQPGEARRYRETFDEAYYALDPNGNVDIVLRRAVAPGDAGASEGITQLIHINSVWRSIPGNTFAHSTQINATVKYHILSGRLGATFEGAGSVFYRRARRSAKLNGTLDLATLRPKRRLAAGAALFQQAVIRGQFEAMHDPRRVTQLINDMNRRFGLGRADIER
jgi:hypothetical protein